MKASWYLSLLFFGFRLLQLNQAEKAYLPINNEKM